MCRSEYREKNSVLGLQQMYGPSHKLLVKCRSYYPSTENPREASMLIHGKGRVLPNLDDAAFLSPTAFCSPHSSRSGSLAVLWTLCGWPLPLFFPLPGAVSPIPCSLTSLRLLGCHCLSEVFCNHPLTIATVYPTPGSPFMTRM